MDNPQHEQASAPGMVAAAMLNPPTRKNLLKVLAAGFLLVIVLLLSAGYVSFQGLESIEAATAALQQEQTATSRIVAEIQGEQAALSAIFYKLSGDPENVDREAILQDQIGRAHV